MVHSLVGSGELVGELGSDGGIHGTESCFGPERLTLGRVQVVLERGRLVEDLAVRDHGNGGSRS